MKTMSCGEEFQQKVFVGRTFTLLFFSLTSFVLTEQTDTDVWGRPQIAHANGGYEGVIVAVHKNVPQDKLPLDRIKEVIKTASKNIYNATGKYFRDVVIHMPPSWDVTSYMTSNEIKYAGIGEDYERSHIRIRTSYEIGVNNIEDDSFSESYTDEDRQTPIDAQHFVVIVEEQSEPFVHQPGKCGEESVFISVTPEFIMNKSGWGDPARALVHLWGHFRWGLFDEYHHSPFNCTDDQTPKDKQNDGRCSIGIENMYKRSRGNDGVSPSYDDLTLEAVCLDSLLDKEVFTVIPQNLTGSIMSVASYEMINEFCHNSPNRSSTSKHSENASNRHNQMCLKKSSWEVMEHHSDFGDKRMTLFEEPNFTLMIKKVLRKLVVMENTDNIARTCTLLPYSSDCYVLQYLALSDSSGTIGVANKTHYSVMNGRFEIVDVQSFTDKSIEIFELVILENTSGLQVNRFFHSLMEMNFTRCTFLGDKFEKFSPLEQCQYSTVTDYLDEIHYDDVEEFVRILSQEGTINVPDYSQNKSFILDYGLDGEFTIIRLRWDKGNMAIAGRSLQSVYNSENLVEKRVDETAVGVGDEVSFTLTKTGLETVTFALEVFSKASAIDNDVEPIIVRPYLKSSSVVIDCASVITVYTSVTRNDKPILAAYVVANIFSSDGLSVEVVLKDANFYEDFEDGIYSANFVAFSGSDNYTIEVRALGKAGRTAWNVERLQPSGILPPKISLRKLRSEPTKLHTDFKRSPRSISLEVHCQDPSPVPSSAGADTTFLDRTSQGDVLIEQTDSSTSFLLLDETITLVGTQFDVLTMTDEGFTTANAKITDESTLTADVQDDITSVGDATFESKPTGQSTHIDTTFRDRTSQTTPSLTEEDVTTYNAQKTDVLDHTAKFGGTTVEPQTTNAKSTSPYSTYINTTLRDRTSQTTPRLTNEDVTASVATKTDELDDTTTFGDTTVEPQTTNAKSTSPYSTYINTNLRDRTSQTTSLTNEDVTASIAKKTDELDGTTTFGDTTVEPQTTNGKSTAKYSSLIDTTLGDRTGQTTPSPTNEGETTSSAKETDVDTLTTHVLDDTSTVGYTTVESLTTNGQSTAPYSTHIDTTFRDRTSQTTPSLTDEGVRTFKFIAKETDVLHDTTFSDTTVESKTRNAKSTPPHATNIDTTLLDRTSQTTPSLTDESVRTSSAKQADLVTFITHVPDDTSTAGYTTVESITTKGKSTATYSTHTDTTLLDKTSQTTPSLTDEVVTTSSSKKTGVVKLLTHILDDTSTHGYTTVESLTTNDRSAVPFIDEITFSEGTTSATHHLRSEILKITNQNGIGLSTSVLVLGETSTSAAAMLDSPKSTAVSTNYGLTTPLSSTMREIPEYSTKKDTTSAEMTTHSSREIFKKDTISSTTQKLAQNSTTTTATILLDTLTKEGSPPTVNKGGICSDDKRWICIFVPTVAVAIILFAIAYLIEVRSPSRTFGYSIENREKEFLGFRTYETAKRYELRDVEMQTDD